LDEDRNRKGMSRRKERRSEGKKRLYRERKKMRKEGRIHHRNCVAKAETSAVTSALETS
jgi:hypothetical protein